MTMLSRDSTNISPRLSSPMLQELSMIPSSRLSIELSQRLSLTRSLELLSETFQEPSLSLLTKLSTKSRLSLILEMLMLLSTTSFQLQSTNWFQELSLITFRRSNSRKRNVPWSTLSRKSATEMFQ